MTREDAIKKVRQMSLPKEIMEILEALAPELEENEDERIRKGLIEALKTTKNIGELKFILPEPTREECIAYLEKQKKPHYTKRNALFDKCVENCDPEVMQRVSDEVDEMLQKEQKPAEKPSMLELLREHLANTPKEQLDAEFEALKEFTIPKPAEWSEEDSTKIGTLSTIISDCAFYKDALDENGDLKDEYAELDAWLSELPERFNLQPKEEWSEEDEEALREVKLNFEINHEDMTPALVDCYDRFFEKVKSLRPVKQEWSEEDEKMRNLIAAIFEVNHPDGFFKANELGTTDMRGVHTEEIVSWLKSLRP